MLANLLTFALISPVHAAQSHNPKDFDNTYEVECLQSELGLSVGLAIFTGEGAWATGAGSVSPLSCEVVIEGDVTWTAWYDEVADECPAWLDASICDDIASGLAEFRADISNDMLAQIPGTVDFTVRGTNNFWNKLLGVYPVGVTFNYDDGPESGTFLINNNDGASYGDFLGAAATAGLGASEWLICGAGSLSVVTGQVDRGTPFTHESTWDTGAELVCATGTEGLIIAVSVGIAYGADLDGEAL